MLKKIVWLVLPLCMAYAVHAADILKPVQPGDNDQLIKHYMDTRDPRYLRTMLETYAEADDALLRDARRYAFLVPQTKNPKSPRPNMAKTVAVALCQKYHCGTNPMGSKPFMQMMTASSGMWALDSLSRQDPKIKKIVDDFLAQNARMKKIYAEEGLQFSNYMTLTLVAVVQPEKVDGVLTRYEQLQPLDMEEVKRTLDMKPVSP